MSVTPKSPSQAGHLSLRPRAEASALTARGGGRSRGRALGATADLDTLGDPELVALLLGLRPGDPFATWIAERGLDVLVSHGVGSLTKEARLQRARAVRLQAAVELGLRVARKLRSAPEGSVKSAREVDSWARRRLVDLAHEELWVLLLDPRNHIVGERLLARGGLHGCALHTCDVLRPILREARSAFILVHNHPGGDPCPSPEDVTFTHRVAAAADIVELVLVDHVVVARDGYVSLLEADLLDADRAS